jgi:hypothetical protein
MAFVAAEWRSTSRSTDVNTRRGDARRAFKPAYNSSRVTMSALVKFELRES